jgi:hypothetical protein
MRRRRGMLIILSLVRVYPPPPRRQGLPNHLGLRAKERLGAYPIQSDATYGCDDTTTPRANLLDDGIGRDLQIVCGRLSRRLGNPFCAAGRTWTRNKTVKIDPHREHVTFAPFTARAPSLCWMCVWSEWRFRLGTPRSSRSRPLAHYTHEHNVSTDRGSDTKVSPTPLSNGLASTLLV